MNCLPCRCKQKFLSLTGLSHPIVIIRSLFGLGKFELLCWDEFVHLVDLLNISSFKMSLSTQFVVDPIHFHGPHNFLIILLDEPILLWTYDFNSMCGWTYPLYGLKVILVLFWNEPIYFGLNFKSSSRGWVRLLCGLNILRSSLMGWACPLCGLTFSKSPLWDNSVPLGLKSLIQPVVELINFMDLRLNMSIFETTRLFWAQLQISL